MEKLSEAELAEKNQDLEVYFVGQALTGLLSSNANLAISEGDLAKKAIKIGKTLANHYSPVETVTEE